MGKIEKKTSVGRPSKKKKLILEAALDIFIEKGISNTKIIEIAERAKVNHALVLYYYKSIEELYLDVYFAGLENLKTRTIEALEKNKKDPELMLKEYIYTPFRWAKENQKHAQLWIYFYYLATNHEKYRKINSEVMLTGRQRITHFLKALAAEGKIAERSEEQINQESVFIQSLINGNALMALTQEAGDELQAAENTYKFSKKVIGL